MNIKWDVVGLCETRLAEKSCTTLNSEHILFQKNNQTNCHIGGVATLINKRIKHMLTILRTMSSRVIYIILRIS